MRARAALGGLWLFARAVYWRYYRDQGQVLAGYLAYSAMLAFMPFLIFATALTGFMVGEAGSRAALDALFEVVPEHVALTLEPILMEVIGQRRGGILTVSALGAIWVASNAIEALRIGLDHAYEVDDTRHVALNRLVAIAAVIIGFVIFIALALLVILAPIAFHLIERWTGMHIPAEAALIRYGAAFGMLWLGLWAMHRLLPSRDMSRFVLWPGILASAALWALMATALSVYLAYAPAYSLTYGTLAGAVLALLFFYLTGVALILGAQVNAEVNRVRLLVGRLPLRE